MLNIQFSFMEYVKILLLCFFAAVFGTSCVTLGRYRKVKEEKNTLEIQNAMLFKELTERKHEQENLLNRLEYASKTNGRLELELANTTTELTNTSKMLGESSTKLLEENRNLAQQLTLIKNDNEKKSMVLQTIKNLQAGSHESLYNCQQDLSDIMFGWLNRGVAIEQMRDHVRITLPDYLIFDPSSSNININGNAVLGLLSKYLLEKPAIQVRVVGHTDNTFPSNRGMKDTWEWSMQKSIVIIRSMIRDFNINTNQLTPIGQGEFRPIASNADSEGRSKNRRSELLLYLPGSELPDITELKQ